MSDLWTFWVTASAEGWLSICTVFLRVAVCNTVTEYSVPANTNRWPNVRLMLGQRQRRWANIKPTLGQRLVCTGVGFWIRGTVDPLIFRFLVSAVSWYIHFCTSDVLIIIVWLNNILIHEKQPWCWKCYFGSKNHIFESQIIILTLVLAHWFIFSILLWDFNKSTWGSRCNHQNGNLAICMQILISQPCQSPIDVLNTRRI